MHGHGEVDEAPLTAHFDIEFLLDYLRSMHGIGRELYYSNFKTQEELMPIDTG